MKAKLKAGVHSWWVQEMMTSLMWLQWRFCAGVIKRMIASLPGREGFVLYMLHFEELVGLARGILSPCQKWEHENKLPLKIIFSNL